MGLDQPINHFAEALRQGKRLASGKEVFRLFLDENDMYIPAHHWLVTSTICSVTDDGVLVTDDPEIDKSGLPKLDSLNQVVSKSGRRHLLKSFPSRKIKFEMLADYPKVMETLLGVSKEELFKILKMMKSRTWSFFFGEMKYLTTKLDRTGIPEELQGPELDAVLRDLDEPIDVDEVYRSHFPLIVGSYAWDLSFGAGLTQWAGGYNQSAIYI